MEPSTALRRFSPLLSQNLAAARELQSFEQAASELQGWIQEKTTLLEGEFQVHSLSPAQPLPQKHRCLQVKALPRPAHPSPSLPGIRSVCLSPSSEMTGNGCPPEPLLQDIGPLPSSPGTRLRF